MSFRDPEANPDTSRWQVILMLVATMALWGGTWPVGRVVSASVDPWNAALLRFAMAAAVLVLICLRLHGTAALRVPARLLPHVLMLAASGIFCYSFLFFTGLKTTEAGRAGLIVGFIPACIALCSAAIEHRRPSRNALAGILISLAGVWIVISRGDPLALIQSGVKSGDLMILGCVFCWTAYTLLARPVMNELPPLIAVTWSCLLGTAMILPFALGGGLLDGIRTIDAAAWSGIFYLGVPATSLAYFAYYHAIRRLGGVASGVFINLVPLFALLSGWIFLDENLHPGEWLGGALVISGVTIAMRTRSIDGHSIRANSK